MPNHYHLLIETLRPTLVKGMQFLNSTYTRRFNIRHKTSGHLFQGRYKALLVDGDSKGYFITVSNYIHFNPIRARLASELKALLTSRWNSSGWLTGNRPQRPAWLRWERVFGELDMASWTAVNCREYRKFLGSQVTDKSLTENWNKIRHGWCFGSERFLTAMKIKLLDLANCPRQDDTWNSEAVEELETERAKRFIAEALRKWNYQSLQHVQGKDRYLLAKFVRQNTKVSTQWLAHQLGLAGRNSLSNGIYVIGKQLTCNPQLKTRFSQLLQ